MPTTRTKRSKKSEINEDVEHFNGVLKLNAAVAGHAAHAMDTRMAAAEYGVPIDTMRGMQHAADSSANSAAMASGNRDLGAAPMDTSGPSAAPPPAAPGTSRSWLELLSCGCWANGDQLHTEISTTPKSKHNVSVKQT